jgi:hypothetical protein
MEAELVIHSADVLVLGSVVFTTLKYAIPMLVSTRDSMRDTANLLKELKADWQDHGERIRGLEGLPARRRRGGE